MLEYVLIALGVVMLLAWRPVAGHWAYKFLDLTNKCRLDALEEKKFRYPTLYRDKEPIFLTKPSNFNWFSAICWAPAWIIGISLFIPLILLFTSTKRFKIGAEKQAELKAREKKIQEMEKELGLEAGND